MKKIIFSLFLGLFACATSICQDVSQVFNQELYNGLVKKIENFSVKDKNIYGFRYLDREFTLAVSPIGANFYYIDLCLGVPGLDLEDTDAIINACHEVNTMINGIKASYNGTLWLHGCMYVKDKPTLFLDIFSYLSKNILQAETLFKNLCQINKETEKVQQENKKQESDQTDVKSESSSTQNYNICYFFPHVENYFPMKMYITHVILYNDKTEVRVLLYNNGRDASSYISSNTYLKIGDKKYLLKDVDGISTDRVEPTVFPNYESGNDVGLFFSLFFEPIPEQTKSFDLVEEINKDQCGFKLEGVRLNNNGWAVLSQSEIIENEVASSRCTHIQVIEDRIVLVKEFTGKQENSGIYTTYEEFIEDANTGKKYPISKSNMGHRSFQIYIPRGQVYQCIEVYTWLPEDLKKINISNGESYYIKDLDIR